MKKSVHLRLYAALAIAATAIALAASGCGVGGDANYSPEVDAFLRQFNGGSSTGGKDTSSTNIDGLDLRIVIVPPSAGRVEVGGSKSRLSVTAIPNDKFGFDSWACWPDGNFVNQSAAATELHIASDAATITANFKQIGKIEGAALKDTRDGQSYPTVRIGKLTWMAENLNYTTATTDTDSSWCYDGNCNTYGRLYNWNAAKSACPSGWRLPDNEDWDDLVETAGGYAVAGTKLKAKSGWGDGNGTDDFGFSALPGGNRDSGGFLYVGYFGYWWSATEYDGGNAYFRLMHYYDDYVYEYNYFKSNGFSVRCVGAAQ